MSDMISTTSSTAPVQTAENTTAPHEAPAKPKYKRGPRLTAAQRAAKIASGWNPPGRKPQQEHRTIFNAELDDALISSQPQNIEANLLLKALVEQLVALENDPQYRSVWTHFFIHGGVYTGPKYIDELNDAIQYLIGIEGAKTSVGEQS